MTTVSEPKAKIGQGELRFLVQGIDWEGYETLRKLLPRVRMTYNRGVLEFMSPLFPHELFKRRLGKLVECLAEELDFDYTAAGSTTFHKRVEDRGLEPDESYYFASARLIRSIKNFDPEVDPPPDLAIEVDITSSSLDRLSIYASLGVPEVWRFDGEVLLIYVLSDLKTYSQSEQSLAFPLVPMSDVLEFVTDPVGIEMGRWTKRVRAWIHKVVMPRYEDRE